MLSGPNPLVPFIPCRLGLAVKNIGFVTGSKHTFDNGGDWEGHNNDLDFTFETPLPAFTQIYYGMGSCEASSIGTKNVRGYITMMVYEA